MPPAPVSVLAVPQPGPGDGVIQPIPGKGSEVFLGDSPIGGMFPFDGFRRGTAVAAEQEGPFAPDPFRMSAAFPANSIGLSYARTRDVDRGEADESAFAIDLVWKLTDRAFFTFGAPLVIRDPVNDSNTAGIGDLEFGLRWVAYSFTRQPTLQAREERGAGTPVPGTAGGFRRASGSTPSVGTYASPGGYGGGIEDFYLTVGLNVTVPTGDRDRGLGEGHTFLEPVVLTWYHLGGGTVFQSDIGLGVPVSGGQGNEVFRYNFALSQSLESTKDWQFFRWVTPLIELNGATSFGGRDSGGTVVNLTPGVRWEPIRNKYAGVAYSFPLTGSREFDGQFIFSFICDF